jgi:uncharacterized protein YxeA
MKKVLMIVLALIVAAMLAVPAYAHNECGNGKGKGVQRYEHTHGQSNEPVQLCLPEAAENGVHGAFH